MAWNQLAGPYWDAVDNAGWCLRFAQSTFVGNGNRTPQLYYCAFIAWENTAYKHADYNLPLGVAVPVWYTWYGTIEGEYRNWGHVATYFNGKVFTSPGSGFGSQWFNSIDELGAAWGLRYDGWSEDIGGLRVVEYVAEAAPVPAVLEINQRLVRNQGAMRWSEPTSQSVDLGEPLTGGGVANFNGWIHGEKVSGNNLWFRGISGNFFWAGDFVQQNKDGLEDLNPVIIKPTPIPAPVQTDTYRKTTNKVDVISYKEPKSSSVAVKVIPKASMVTLTSWINGEKLSNNNLWFKDDSGSYIWAGNFAKQNKDGLIDLTPVVTTPVVVPPVVETPVIETPIIETPVVVTPDPIITKDTEMTNETPRGFTLSQEQYNTVQTDITKALANADDVSQYDLISVGFWNFTTERVLKTFFQALASQLSVTSAIVITNPASANIFADLGWGYIASVAGVAAMYSLFTALASFKNIFTPKSK